jgi:hypothetical protein
MRAANIRASDNIQKLSTVFFQFFGKGRADGPGI